MKKLLPKNRSGFVLVELMILAVAVALIATVAFTHFKRQEPAKFNGSMQVAEPSQLRYAIQTYPEIAAVNAQPFSQTSERGFSAPDHRTSPDL